MKKFLLGVIILAFVSSGCDSYSMLFKMIKNKLRAKQQQKALEAQPVLPPVEDVNLAKMLLKPKRERLYIRRDPFKPLSVFSKAKVNQEVSKEDPNELIKDIDYMGVVRIGEKTAALMGLNGKKNVYSVGDKINQLTIVGITDENIILKKDDKTYSLKRGNQQANEKK